MSHLRAGGVFYIASFIAFTAYYAQNVLGIFSIQEISKNIESMPENIIFLVISICILIESIIVAAYYFPGTAIVVVSLIAYPSIDPLKLWLVATVSALVGYETSYLLGRFSSKFVVRSVDNSLLEKAKSLVARWKFAVFAISTVHFNFAALLSAALGLLQLPQRLIIIFTSMLSGCLVVIFSKLLPLLTLAVGNDISNYQLYIGAACGLIGVYLSFRSWMKNN